MGRAKKGLMPRPYLVKNAMFGTMKSFHNLAKARKYKNKLNKAKKAMDKNTEWKAKPNMGLAHIYKLIE